jgi:hypothetical protein
MSDVERSRRYRERQRAGLAMVSIAIEPGLVGELLVDGGFLEPWDADNLDAIRAALEQAIEVWARA